ncbi:hypothetical protein PMAYCL1PPCAC_14723, partial [Pristionchus mayeri]
LKVFIGNLPHDSTPSDIDTVLENAGLTIEEIRTFNIHMVRDRESDQFKGFAYVEVSAKDQLDKVLTLNGCEFDGRPLKVDNKTGRGGGRGGRGGGRGRGGSDRGFERGGRGGGYGGDRGGWGRERERGDYRFFPSGGRGGHHFEGQGGFVKGEMDFEVVRGRGHHGGRGGHHNRGERPERPAEAPIGTGDDSGRPRLQLTKKVMDPKEMEEKKRQEEEAEKARKEKIFGH